MAEIPDNPSLAENWMKLLSAVKALAVKDYLQAVRRNKVKEIKELELFFDEIGILERVKYNAKFKMGQFDAEAMLHIPDHWKQDDFTFKCKMCNIGHVKVKFLEWKKNNNQKYTIMFYCDSCGFMSKFKMEGIEDEDMKKAQKKYAELSDKTRYYLYHEELDRELKEHPDWSQREIDALVRRLTGKWKI
jgi:RNase P subunit RPR2